MAVDFDQEQVWKTFCLSIGAEPREAKSIRGRSGLDHEAQAIAVDDKGKRLVVIAAEADSRTAALMQVDIQATMPDVHCIVARPITFDISSAARKLIGPLGVDQIDFKEARGFVEKLKNSDPEETRKLIGLSGPDTLLADLFGTGSAVPIPPMPLIMSLISQASLLPWREILNVLDESISGGKLDFSQILASDTIESDLQAGVCPIPFYEFAEDDLAAFVSGRDLDEARSTLKRLGIYQYFFPPADQLSLGIVDQGLTNREIVISAAASAPELGHPFGVAELVSQDKSLIETLEELKAIGYVAEGEQGLEVTDNGKTIRSTVKFRPREGLLTKLLSRFSFNASVSPSDFIK